MEAEDNLQMKLYAIRGLEMFDNFYNIDEVVTTIFQPHISNISTRILIAKEMMHWSSTDSKKLNSDSLVRALSSMILYVSFQPVILFCAPVTIIIISSLTPSFAC